MQWIPSHIGVTGNERADTLANEGSKQDQKEVQITFKAAKACIKKTMEDQWERRFKAKGGFYLDIKKSEEEKYMTRRDRTTLAQLRTGHSNLAKAYRFRIGLADDGNCNLCKIEETVDHIIKICPKYTSARLHAFGTANFTPGEVDGRSLINFIGRAGLVAQ